MYKPGLDAVEAAYKILIAASVDSNAETMEINLEDFSDVEGNHYGDFHIVVTRKWPEGSVSALQEGAKDVQ